MEIPQRPFARRPNPARLALSTLRAALLLAVSAVFVFPFLWMLTTSFKSLGETLVFPPALLPARWMAENYQLAWKEGHFPSYVLNSVVVSLSILACQFLVVIPAAYAFACRSFPGKGLLFGLVLCGLMIPGQATFLPVYLMFSELGLIDTYAALVAPMAASAFGIFLIAQSFRQVPLEVLEAARLDKAGTLRLILRVLLPMSKPAIITFALFSFIAHWNDYFWTLSMTTSDAIRTLPIGVAMLKDVENVKSWHVIMAGNMILIAPVLAIYLVASKYIKTAFTYSGVK
jgi:sn-glycerol 3-phosphate transport system permease protein